MKVIFKISVFIMFLFFSLVACKNNETKDENAKENKVENNVSDNQNNDYNDLKPMNLSTEEVKKLNTFFSNFSEVMLSDFKRNEIPDNKLISFGVFHNHINNYKKFEKEGEYDIKIKKEYVEESVQKYFNLKITNHQSTDEIIYKNGYYIITNSSGEAYFFSQLVNLYDIGNDEFLADVNIYAAGSGWTGDSHASPQTWDKNDEVPQLYSTMSAIVKKTNDNYILLEYLEKK